MRRASTDREIAERRILRSDRICVVKLSVLGREGAKDVYKRK